MNLMKSYEMTKITSTSMPSLGHTLAIPQGSGRPKRTPFSTFREFSDRKSTLFLNFTDLRMSLILAPIFAIFRTLMRVSLVIEWGYRGMYQLRNYSPQFLAMDSPSIFNVQMYSPLFSEKPKETPFKSTSFEKLLCFIASDPTNVCN